MKVTPEEVYRTAQLARLEVPNDEIERTSVALSAILDYFEKLGEIDVSGVEPMVHAVAISLRLREDALNPHLMLDEALAAAPESQGSFFEVPRVIAHDKEER